MMLEGAEIPVIQTMNSPKPKKNKYEAQLKNHVKKN